MYKFSKKTTSILFLLAALFIALFIGSLNFANAFPMMESLDNMDSTVPTPSAATPASKPSKQDIEKLVSQYTA